MQYTPSFGPRPPGSEVSDQECLARGGAGAFRGAHRVRPIFSHTHHSQASRIMHDFGRSEDRRTERARWPMDDGTWYSHRLRRYESRCRAAQSPQTGMTRMIGRRGGPVDPGAKALTVGSGPPPVEDRWPLTENSRHHPPDGRTGAGGVSRTVANGLSGWKTDLAGEVPRIQLTQRARKGNQG